MPLWRGLRPHTRHDSVIARARAYPSGDYRRWQTLGELATADFKTSFERAAALLRTSSDPASMTLGAEIFDQLFIGKREGPRLAREATELLREVCRRPDQHPEVLSAALHPYAELSRDAQALLYELLDHADAPVRRTSAQLIATSGDNEFADDRQVEALIALLDRDPDPEVREEAAEGLELVLACYAYVRQAPGITATLKAHLNDPLPRVRVAALRGTGALEIDATVKQLVSELSAVEIVWQLVDSFNHLALLGTCDVGLRTEAHLILQRLEDQGWPESSADPARYPVAHERAEMLAGAIRATSPHPQDPYAGPPRFRRSWTRRG